MTQVAESGCGPWAAGRRNLRQQVFETVRASGLISRANVAKHLGVSPATVTATVSELIQTGFVQEVAASSRGSDNPRGRPPVALGVRPSARYVAGIKLSHQTHTAVIVDFAGGLVADVALPRSTERLDLEELLADTEHLLNSALNAARLTRTDLASIGLGIPGVVDYVTGVVNWSPLMQDINVELRSALGTRLGRPVEIDNDANMVTLAELWFGAGRGLSDFAVVTIEHGVGMGLVLDHRLYRGGRGVGLEIGHTKVQLDGALCRCGQRGCLEAYVADYALIREARTALNLGDKGVKSPQILLESLYDHAKAGNQAARAIFSRAGRYLAVGLANVVNVFDPNLILLSGERMRYDYLYAEEVLTEMQALTLQRGRPTPEVQIHAWGDLIWARGAAALALDATTSAALGPESV